MADVINENGLTLETYNEILTYIQDSMNEIYAVDGNTINFDSETPDGQFTNILAQISADARQLAAEIYNSFNPDNCQGVLQDQRYALNYVFRGAGTYTVQPIDIVVDRTVDLSGLDADYNSETSSAYTVSDNSGNQFYLIDSVTLTAGSYTLPFRCQKIGLVQPTIGTIQNQVTKVLGVVSINNSLPATVLGKDEESDLDFRNRRNRSTAIRGQNNYDALVGQLLEIDGVENAKVFVNNTSSANTTVTDKVDGIPARTVWVIVDTGGANDEIANAIYQNSAGLPTFGDVSVVVETVSGQNYNVNFDRAVTVPFHIKFTIKNNADIPITDDMQNDIKDYLVENLKMRLSLGDPVETSVITNIASEKLLDYSDKLYALDVQVAEDEEDFDPSTATWTDYIASASWQNKFVPDASMIYIQVS